MVIPGTAEIWDSSGQIDPLHPSMEEFGAYDCIVLIAVRPHKPSTTYTVHAGGVVERSYSIISGLSRQAAPPVSDRDSN